MATQNFDSFKPLNEEEEKQIKGGGTNSSNASCAPIAQQIQQTEAMIQAEQSTGKVDQILIKTLNELKVKYQQCLNGQPVTS
jgi:bacteriocin-like protein